MVENTLDVLAEDRPERRNKFVVFFNVDLLSAGMYVYVCAHVFVWVCSREGEQ